MTGELNLWTKDYIHQFFLYVAEKREGTTPAMIRKLASSLKKFYICMYEMGYVSHWVTEEVLYSVDSNLDTWVKKCEERGDR